MVIELSFSVLIVSYDEKQTHRQAFLPHISQDP